jgi:hypothetical protein
MDRHLKRVERWLIRCVTACRCGSWGDALAEAECLEAETKGLRDKLWVAAEEEASARKRRTFAFSAFTILKVSALAMTMVLTAVIPISFDPEARGGVSAPMESIALLSRTESDIINALRESLSSGNSGRVVISVEIPDESLPPVQNGAALASEAARPAPRQVVAEIAPPAPVAEESGARRPSVDEVISLIQVGQRALRTSEPGVKVVPQL